MYVVRGDWFTWVNVTASGLDVTCAWPWLWCDWWLTGCRGGYSAHHSLSGSHTSSVTARERDRDKGMLGVG